MFDHEITFLRSIRRTYLAPSFRPEPSVLAFLRSITCFHLPTDPGALLAPPRSIMLWIGFFFSKRQESLGDYYLGGRR